MKTLTISQKAKLESKEMKKAVRNLAIIVLSTSAIIASVLYYVFNVLNAPIY